MKEILHSQFSTSPVVFSGDQIELIYFLRFHASREIFLFFCLCFERGSVKESQNIDLQCLLVATNVKTNENKAEADVNISVI